MLPRVSYRADVKETRKKGGASCQIQRLPAMGMITKAKE